MPTSTPSSAGSNTSSFGNFASNLFGGTLSNMAGSFGSAFGTNLANGIFSGWQRRQAMALYKRQLAKQMEYQKEMANFNQDLQKSYDTWYSNTFNKAWERSQLEAAGLSPALMYGGKSGASAAGMSSAGKGVASAPMGSPGILPSGSSGAGPSIGQYELQSAQAKLFDAQAQYWENKAHTEESMPSYYDAITKLNTSIREIENFLKPKKGNLLDSEAGKNNSASAVNWSISKLNDLQWTIDNLYYTSLTKSYHVRYKGMNGVLYDQSVPGYLLKPFQDAARLAGSIMNNDLLGNTLRTHKKKLEADISQAIASASVNFSASALHRIELEMQQELRKFEIARRKSVSRTTQYEEKYAEWRNKVAPDQRKFENYLQGAHLVLDALGTVTSMQSVGQRGKFYDRLGDHNDATLEERRYEFDHRDPAPTGKTRVYQKNGYTDINHY